jgi:hypothetical protein
MNMRPPKVPYDGYCGNSYAAKMLGISAGTVQVWSKKVTSKLGRLKAVTVEFLCSRFKTTNAATIWSPHP